MASDEVPAGWARLNVGGKVFVTMKQTLISSPFFARLFETDDRMPDATAGSPTHFIDRDPECFSEVLNYLRNGTLLVDKNCNLEKLRLEADFYGLEILVKLVDNVKAETELRSSMKTVTVKFTGHGSQMRIGVTINPRDDGHFLLRHLQQHYPCRVSTPAFVFPYGFTFALTACTSCQWCQNGCYTTRCWKPSHHGCGCPLLGINDPALRDDVILKDVVSTLETHGYVLDQGVETAITAAGRSPTSWTFVKREG